MSFEGGGKFFRCDEVGFGVGEGSIVVWQYVFVVEYGVIKGCKFG